MKNYNSFHKSYGTIRINLRLGWVLFLLIGFGFNMAFAQDETAAEEKEPLRSRMSLTAIQKDNDQITLDALVRARIDERYIGLPGLEVTFHSLLADSLDKELGKALTNENGIASLTISSSELYRDTADTFELLVEFEGNEDFKKSDDDIRLTAAKMKLEVEREDSLKVMNILLESRGEPIVDEDVALFVKGLFSPLKVGEGTTDENGKASINFPLDLPGDSEGNLHIFGQLEEHDDYGSVQSTTTKAWSIPTEAAPADPPRALWSSNPPLWLLLTFIAILVVIWGHYIETIYQLFRLKKEAEIDGNEN